MRISSFELEQHGASPLFGFKRAEETLDSVFGTYEILEDPSFGCAGGAAIYPRWPLAICRCTETERVSEIGFKFDDLVVPNPEKRPNSIKHKETFPKGYVIIWNEPVTMANNKPQATLTIGYSRYAAEAIAVGREPSDVAREVAWLYFREGTGTELATSPRSVA